MQKSISIAEARNKLPSIIHSVEEGPAVQLTRYGRPVAVLLSVQEYERLKRKKKSFWQALMAYRQDFEEKGIRISDSDFEGLRDRTVGREVDVFK